MACGDKHFLESKTHPRIHKHLTKKPKTWPDSKTHVMLTGRGFLLLIESRFSKFLIPLLFPCFPVWHLLLFNSTAIKPYSQAIFIFFLWNWYLLHRTLKYLICMAHKELLVTWCNIYWHNDGMAWVHNTWSIPGPQCL